MNIFRELRLAPLPSLLPALLGISPDLDSVPAVRTVTKFTMLSVSFHEFLNRVQRTVSGSAHPQHSPDTIG